MKPIASMKVFGSTKALAQFLLSVVAALGMTACATALPQQGQMPGLKHIMAWTPIPYVPDPKVIAREQTTETFKMDGLTHNHAHVADMIASLKHKEGGFPLVEGFADKWTTMLALARLGATEALPALDSIASQSKEPAERAFIFAASARLLAETEATPHAKAARFFKEIGETPEQMNTVLQQYYIDWRRSETAHSSITAVISHKEGPAEAELADMIYHGAAAELLADPLIAQMDFNTDSNTYFKIQLALLPPDQQRQKIMDRIVKEVDCFWTGQLLIDLGRPEAIEAITAKLREIDENWDAYKPYGYGRLLTVLYVCGDHHQSPIWTHLVHGYNVSSIGSSFGEQRQFRTDY